MEKARILLSSLIKLLGRGREEELAKEEEEVDSNSICKPLEKDLVDHQEREMGRGTKGLHRICKIWTEEASSVIGVVDLECLQTTPLRIAQYT